MYPVWTWANFLAIIPVGLLAEVSPMAGVSLPSYKYVNLIVLLRPSFYQISSTCTGYWVPLDRRYWIADERGHACGSDLGTRSPLDGGHAGAQGYG